MALAPKGDPRRPLQLAVRSTRVLAVLFLLVGTCAIFPMLISGGPMRIGAAVDVGVLLIYVGPGILYLIVAMYLQRRRFWAVVVGLVLASIQLFFTVAGAAGMIFLAIRGGGGLSIIPVVVVAFVMLALGQLIYHLAMSFEAIKYEPPEENPHGFEPLVVEPPPLYPGKEET